MQANKFAPKNIISKIILEVGISQFGVANFEIIQNKLIPCSKIKDIPQNAKTILSFIFPYYAGKFENSNISKYAVAPDYHNTILNKLNLLAQAFKQNFSDFEFVPFCDNSPVPEVYTAALAGLGCIGKNGLLIHLKYGSFVFIGEIITDMQIDACVSIIKSCENCDACINNCPSKALNNENFEKTKCLSFVSQKKKDLTSEEKTLLNKTGCIWGCDICQNVCPMNKNIEKTKISEFSNDLKPIITQDELEDDDFEAKNRDRAYLWKGRDILKRNLCIINATKEDNKTNSKKFEKE
jgi:epoxyqueuosine reductase